MGSFLGSLAVDIQGGSSCSSKYTLRDRTHQTFLRNVSRGEISPRLPTMHPYGTLPQQPRPVHKADATPHRDALTSNLNMGIRPICAPTARIITHMANDQQRNTFHRNVSSVTQQQTLSKCVL